MIVGVRPTAPGVELTLPTIVAEEHEEMRRTRYPVLIGQQVGDTSTLCGILDDENVALLQIALGWRRQCQRTKRVDQLWRQRLALEAAHDAASCHPLPVTRRLHAAGTCRRTVTEAMAQGRPDVGHGGLSFL